MPVPCASAITNGAENNSGERIDHKKLYLDIQAARATGKTGDACRPICSSALTSANKSDNAMRAVHFQLAFIYTGSAWARPSRSLPM
jgi:hypothetical protein